MRAVIVECPCGVDDPDDQIGQPLKHGFLEQVFFVRDGFGEDDEDEEESQDFEAEEVFGGEESEDLQEDGGGEV